MGRIWSTGCMKWSEWIARTTAWLRYNHCSSASLFKSNGAVENHIERGALAQFDFPAARKQDGRKAHGRACACSDTGSPRAAVDDGSQRAATACEDGDARGVLTVGRSLLDGVLFADDLLIARAGVDRGQRRRKLVNRAAGECDGLETNRQLGVAFDPPATFGVGDHSLDVTADRQDDTSGDADRAAGAQIDIIAVLGRARGDGIFHSQKDVGALRNFGGESGESKT